MGGGAGYTFETVLAMPYHLFLSHQRALAERDDLGAKDDSATLAGTAKTEGERTAKARFAAMRHLARGGAEA